jgi:ATP-dependent DNA helicase RecQ
MLKVLDVDGAVRRVRGGWEATGQEWAYDAERYQRVAEAREREQQAMLDYLTTDRCRMWFLRDQLDDPGAADDWTCGRCDNCGGLDLPVDVSSKAVADAADRLARPGVPIEPRKLWPTGLSALGVDRSGRIKQPAEEGRAIARLTDLGHGTALRELFRAGDGEAPTAVPTPLVRAVVAMLADWRPDADVIVVTESATRSALVADLASGLSRYLQRPVVGRWAITDPSVLPSQGATNSAQRVAAVTRRHGLQLDEPGAVRGRRVLLVDDLVATGWSLTLAADALVGAGADAVLPLTLAVSA